MFLIKLIHIKTMVLLVVRMIIH